MLEQHNIYIAFLYTTLAGLSTMIGALLVLFFRRCYRNILALGLGFSAGIMLYLSFFDLLSEAKEELLHAGLENINSTVVIFFIIGLAIAGIIDAFTHRHIETCLGPEEILKEKGCGFGHKHRCRRMLLKTGMFTTVALALHNFPEGIATFSATTVNITFGLSIALAIAIHNIPEGFCIALPIYLATKKFKKSLFYTAISALAEPLGALVAYLFLFPFINEYIMGGILASVAGIMVYVSIDSLLPTATRMGRWHTALGGMILGMLAMFVILKFLI